MSNSKEVSQGCELTYQSLEDRVNGHTQLLDTLPTNPFQYTILFQSNMYYQGGDYVLIYKICRPEDSNMITKLSLVIKQQYMSKIFAKQYPADIQYL